MDELLSIQHVTKDFTSGGELKRAVNDVSFSMPSDKSVLLTVAGESGCGKSTLALMALGFMPPSSGRFLYQGKDIYSHDKEHFLKFRREVQAVFQNPFEAFNPFYRIDRTFHVVIRRFGLTQGGTTAENLMVSALRAVDLDPTRVLGKYPHEVSGGQLQRAAIARAFMLKPRLLIADEPVSMVDASLRLRILRHLIRLKLEFGTSILYITHDLSTALQVSDEIMIAHQGSIVERGRPEDVILSPQHEYTKRLIGAVPVPDPMQRWGS
jgi:peptide/nickel transport system ATP-binding protein